MSDASDSRMIDWSYSAAALFASCPRAFYFRYIQSSDTSSGESTRNNRDPDPVTAGSLIGTAVHESISEQVSLWRDGEPTSMEGAISTATDVIHDRIDSSTLSGTAVPEDEETALEPVELAGVAKQHLRRFFRVIWPQFDSHQYICHETTRSFPVDGHTVWVRPDLCTRNADGQFVITDWKTSSPDFFSDTSLQIRAYGLWAYREYEPDPERISVQLVHTSTGEFDIEKLNSATLDRVRDRIVADCEAWMGKQAESEFTADSAIQKCRDCSYLHRCSSGQEVISDEQTH